MENRTADNAYIGKTVRHLREDQGLDLKDLSARLADLGYPLAVNTLSRLETNLRKVSAAELLPLAAALGVTPNMLLLGDGQHEDGPAMQDMINVPGLGEVTLLQAWQWVQGEQLPMKKNEAGALKLDTKRKKLFRARSTPHDPKEALSIDEYNELQAEGVFSGLSETKEKLAERGYGLDTLRQQVEVMKTAEAQRRNEEAQREDGSAA